MANVFALRTLRVDVVIRVQIQLSVLIKSLAARYVTVMLSGLGHPSATCKQDSVIVGHMSKGCIAINAWMATQT